MKRTYRSKKDTGGALDHIDVLLNRDEKISAFDAFYIQNIKQTKREQSCVLSANPAGIPSNRVRKKKYVKRLVKHVKPVRVSDRMSSSAYLTPDKSIRVNKILDPFDMLLNSSPVNEERPKAEVDVFVPKKEKKTYRKRRRQLKKFNYSTSDSSFESNKENTIDSNVTNIKAFELLVENVPEERPKETDDSIKKLYSNLPILCNSMSKNYSGSFNTSYKNRLCKAYISPVMQQSPLCSTPFKEKKRGVSILKFSPITQKSEQSQIQEALQENNESNHSIILVCKSVPRKISEECKECTIAASNASIKNSTDLTISNDNSGCLNISTKTFEESNIELFNEQCNNVQQKEYASQIDISSTSFQKSEVEPFLGFSKNDTEILSDVKMKMRSGFEESLSIKNNTDDDVSLSLVNEAETNSSTLLDDIQLRAMDSTHSESNSLSNSDKELDADKTHLEKSFNSTKSESNSLSNSDKELDADITHLEKSFNSTKSESNSLSNSDKELDADKIHLEKSFDSTKSESNSLSNSDKELDTDKTHLEKSFNSTKSSIFSNKYNTSNVSQSESSDKASHYDTCNSDQSTDADETQAEKEPIVIINRMNDSTFLKYYEKMIRHKDNDNSEQTDDDDFKSLANYSNAECTDESMSDDCNYTKYKLNPINITDDNIISTEKQGDNENKVEEYEKEERCVSFVTTRRRNKIIKDSMFMFDKSYGSSSTECDKTVLSNKKISIDSSEKVNVTEFIINDDNRESMTHSESAKTDNINEKISVDSQQSIRCTSFIPKICNNKVNDEHSPESSINLKIPTRKSSRISRKSRTSTISKDKSPTDIRVSRVTSRKSSRLTKRSYSISSESESEKPIVDTYRIEDLSVFDNNTLKDESVLENKHKVTHADISTSSNPERFSYIGTEGKVKSGIVLQPGKKWERSLSIYRRITMAENLDQSILEESMQNKGRKYRQSVITTIEMQEGRDSLHNDSINSRRSSILSNANRPTIRFVKEPDLSRVSLNSSSVFDDLKGYLSEECDDTVIELSKLSIADSDHEVTVLDNFHETERVTTAKDFVLRRCNQTEPILFDECYPETVLKNCHKIGEGVYGEVFLWRGRDGRARVMKIVPIAGTLKVNGEAQKDFHEIISEIVIAMELSALRAPIADIERQLDAGLDIHHLDLHQIENATDIFNEVLAVRCVYGAYPSRLLDLWELYDECKGSENDNPAALPADQRYIVLELANAGQDLESYQFVNAQQAHALFQQLAFGLAVGEEAFQFEHRDLHWGNVLIAPTEQKLATFVLRGRTYRVPRRGVAATVIDYSLSRLSLPLPAPAGDAGCAALYNDLAADDQLFDAVGDYQFEVYRLMREKLGNEWKNFEPYTNILWLHYIADKMITALRYKRTNTKIHKHYIDKLTAIKNSLLEYGSAVQFVLDNIDF